MEGRFLVRCRTIWPTKRLDPRNKKIKISRTSRGLQRLSQGAGRTAIPNGGGKSGTHSAGGDLKKFKLVKKKRMCYPKPEFESSSMEPFSSVSVFRSIRTTP
jgi:hypothetical protein